VLLFTNANVSFHIRAPRSVSACVCALRVLAAVVHVTASRSRRQCYVVRVYYILYIIIITIIIIIIMTTMTNERVSSSSVALWIPPRKPPLSPWAQNNFPARPPDGYTLHTVYIYTQYVYSLAEFHPYSTESWLPAKNLHDCTAVYVYAARGVYWAKGVSLCGLLLARKLLYYLRLSSYTPSQ